VKNGLVALLIIFCATPVFAATQATDGQAVEIFGRWWTRDKGAQIEIFPCADRVCGRMAWIPHPDYPDGRPKLDDNNPDPALRDRPLLGLPMLSGFAADAPGKWTGGQIYSARRGKYYSARLKLLSPDRLKVMGCFLIFCNGQTWQRVAPGEPAPEPAPELSKE